jgi:predicted RNase H-like HicB family nuclease
MSINLQNKAKIAASWPYAVKMSKEECTDGQIMYLATHPELVGCMAQGATAQEAIENLKEVTFEYMLSLLEDRIPIPLPAAKLTKTNSGIAFHISNTVSGDKPFLDTLSQVVQPCTRQEISVVELVS